MQSLGKTVILTALILFGVGFMLNADESNAETIASGDCGESLTWTYADSGVLTISAKSGYGSGYAHEIPDYTRSNPAPWSQYDIHSVSVTANLRVIGNYAFANESNLTAIALSNPINLERIGNYAFSGCSSLTTDLFGSTSYMSLFEIGSCAFEGCSSLSFEKLSDNISNIGGYAFKDCTGLKVLKFPEYISNTMRAIQHNDNVFDGCTNLKVIFCDSEYGLDMFYGYPMGGLGRLSTSSVYHIYLDNHDNRWTKVTDSCYLYAYAPNIKIACADLELPGELTTSLGNLDPRPLFLNVEFNCPALTIIPSGIFSEWTDLTTVILPSSMNMTEIGPNAFFNCTSLTTIKNMDRDRVVKNGLPDQISRIDYHAFDYCPMLGLTALPSNLEYIGDNAFSDCEALNVGEIPASVYHIGEGAFRGCTLFHATSIPERVTNVSYLAFENTALNLTTLAKNPHYDSEAFKGCTFTELHIPSDFNWAHVDDYAFSGATVTKIVNDSSITLAPGYTMGGRIAYNSDEVLNPAMGIQHIKGDEVEKEGTQWKLVGLIPVFVAIGILIFAISFMRSNRDEEYVEYDSDYDYE